MLMRYLTVLRGQPLTNQLADFNRVVFKKDVSPFKKWAYVEALATFLKLADLMFWMSM